MSDAVKKFAEQATQFCDFMGTVNSLDLPTKLQSLLVFLAELYVATRNLPDVEPTDRDFDLPPQKVQIDFGDIDWY